MARKVAVNDTSKQGTLTYLLFFIGLAALLFYPPFNRGLFFDTELLWAHVYTGALVIFYLLGVRGSQSMNFRPRLMDWAGIGLIIAYVLSTITAYNARDAVGEVLKVLQYVTVYWLVAHGVSGEINMRRVLITLYLSGVGVALMGLGAAYGTVDYNGAFVEGMINSTLQYHNAGAIYMAAAAMIGFYLSADSEELWARLAYSAGNFILITTSIGAQSRGAFLVTAIAILLLIALMPRAYKVRVIISTAVVVGAFMITSHNTLAFRAYSQLVSWGWVLLGCGIAAGLQYGLEYLQKLEFMQNKNVRLGIIGGIALTLVVAALGFSHQVAPGQMVERFKKIDFQQITVQERLYFYRDAVKIAEDHPVLGTGGGGWNAVYRMYQSYPYNSTEVHNHFLQVLVEAGFLGFGTFIALWLGLLWALITVLRRSVDNRTKAMAVAAFVAATTIGLHSAIDFSLSLGSVAIFMFASFGVVRGLMKEFEDGQVCGKNIPSLWVKAGAVLLATGIIVLSISLQLGEAYMSKVQEAYQKGNTPLAASNLESGFGYDPFNGGYALDLARLNLMLADQQQDPAAIDRALDYGKKAVDLGQGNPNVYWSLADIYFRMGDVPKAIELIEQAQASIPLRPEGYDQLSQAYLSVGKSYIQQNDRDKAKFYLEKVLSVENKMNQTMAGIGERERSYWTHHAPLLKPSQAMLQHKQEATTLLGQL